MRRRSPDQGGWFCEMSVGGTETAVLDSSLVGWEGGGGVWLPRSPRRNTEDAAASRRADSILQPQSTDNQAFSMTKEIKCMSVFFGAFHSNQTQLYFLCHKFHIDDLDIIKELSHMIPAML